MKRHLITNTLATLLGVFLSLSATYGQDYDNKIHIGFKIGLNTSSLTKPVGVTDPNSPGYVNSTFAGSQNIWMLTGSAGITADYRINDLFSVSTELLFNGRGTSYQKTREDVVIVDTSGNETYGHDDYNLWLNYVEMPIILRYVLPVGDLTWSSLYFGVAPAFNVFAQAGYSYYTVNPDDNSANQAGRTIDLPPVRNFQLNTLFGYYYEEKHSNFNLPFTMFFDIRYERTYYPVFTNSTYHDQNYQTGIWNLNFSFGIKF
jgi:hypothetical protein